MVARWRIETRTDRAHGQGGGDHLVVVDKIDSDALWKYHQVGALHSPYTSDVSAIAILQQSLRILPRCDHRMHRRHGLA
ncbi:MAG: hypothetical protein QOG10_6779 [Kribbellaceae bacterium]|jgi:hypothetical protein|nr:hypothetical protein [Kribbellaceae bacterium]